MFFVLPVIDGDLAASTLFEVCLLGDLCWNYVGEVEQKSKSLGNNTLQSFKFVCLFEYHIIFFSIFARCLRNKPFRYLRLWCPSLLTCNLPPPPPAINTAVTWKRHNSPFKPRTQPGQWIRDTPHHKSRVDTALLQQLTDGPQPPNRTVNGKVLIWYLEELCLFHNRRLDSRA